MPEKETKELRFYNGPLKAQLTEMLWWDLNRAVHKLMATNHNKTKSSTFTAASCKEEWTKIPPQECERQIKSYRKLLLKLLLLKLAVQVV